MRRKEFVLTGLASVLGAPAIGFGRHRSGAPRDSAMFVAIERPESRGSVQCGAQVERGPSAGRAKQDRHRQRRQRDRRVVDRRRLAAGPRQPRPCVLPVIDIADRARRREPVVVAPCFRGGASLKSVGHAERQARNIPAFGEAGNLNSLHGEKNSLLGPVGNSRGTGSNHWVFLAGFSEIRPKREKLPADFPVTREQPSRISTWPSGVLRCRRLVYVRRT